jgi:glycosyltransferase involved in cell wall biosynthesis
LPQTLLISWILAKIYKGKCIYHPFELYGEQTSKYSRVLLKIESALLNRGVDGVITQNIYRADVYEKERRSRIKPVLVRNTKNGAAVKPNGKLRERLSLRASTKIVLYEGHLIQGRMLDSLVEAMRYMRGSDVVLVLIGQVTDWWSKNCEPVIARFGLDEVVFQLPHVEHGRIIDFIADANLGVIIYDDSCRNNKYCAPGKLSDYLFAGIPIVCPAYPPLLDILGSFKIGLTFEKQSPIEISKKLKEVLSTPSEVWKSNILEALKDYNWESDKTRLIDVYTSLI